MLKSTFINASTIDILYACLLAFVLGSIIALTYVRSFQGLSYSRTFLQSLVLAPLLTAIAMQAIGDSVARGLGMMGAFSLLRFRTNIKDTRDMMFMFASLAMGLGCGVYAYSVVVISIFFFCLAVFVIYKVPFTSSSDFDSVLRLQVDNSAENQSAVSNVLRKYAQRFTLISLREIAQGSRLDISYQVKLQTPNAQNNILKELGTVKSLSDVQLFMQDGADEV